MADLHNQTEKIDAFSDISADLIAFCGDLHNNSGRFDAEPAAKALANLGFPVLIVPGNNDPEDMVPQLWKEMGFIMLHRSSFRYGDYGFFGMGGMARPMSIILNNKENFYNSDGDIYKSLAKCHKKISGSRKKVVINTSATYGRS
jgi:hypothetical protein